MCMQNISQYNITFIYSIVSVSTWHRVFVDDFFTQDNKRTKQGRPVCERL